MRVATWGGLAALAGMTAATAALGRRFGRDMKAIAAALLEGSAIARTSAGPIEYAREGHGTSALVIHGAGGGYDQGLFVGRELLCSGHDIIAPSRFGYLRTPAPAGFEPGAQADAHAALLESLHVGGAIVLGISAGAPSAIELALRHPDKVSALILVVPRAYAPGSEVSAEDAPFNRIILTMIEKGEDFAFWLAARLAPRRVMRFLGVPAKVYAQADLLERARLLAVARSILPLSSRMAGIRYDSETRIEAWPLERIEVPTLVIATADDLYETLPAARYTAEHIKGAELVALETGGHLLVGRVVEIQLKIADFLRRRVEAPRQAAA
jgi:2-hydroxy-6-oxonona-2,4-dienedioate hydrolase